LSVQPTTDDVHRFLGEYFSDQLPAIGVSADALVNQFDLLIEGLIDSLGFLELIAALEGRFAVELDLEQLEVEELTKCGPLIELVVRQAGGSG
jgi:acyl carrier protein